MIAIILKFSACLALFMLMYKLLFEETSAHNFKRVYLLLAVLISLGIPFITFTEYIEVPAPTIAYTEDLSHASLEFNALEGSFKDYLPEILWAVYILGVSIFTFRFLKNLLGIILKIKRNPKIENEPFINVLMKDLVAPHTFFKFIFLNLDKFYSHSIESEVFIHEQTHAREKHSADILFLEVLQIIFWFNPLIYMLRKYMKLNHEFLADRAVLRHGIEPLSYQQLLLEFSSSSTSPDMANAINYSSIKKRFTVMKTKTSRKSLFIRSLLILPILAFSVYGFSEKKNEIVYIPKLVNLEQSESSSSPKLSTIGNDLNQDKVSEAEIAEYNKLAKKYNEMDPDHMQIWKQDLDKLEYIYNRMTKEQKAKAQPYPDIKPPPPPPPAPRPNASNPPASPKSMEKNQKLPPPPPPMKAKKVEGHDVNNLNPNEPASPAEKMPPPPPPPVDPIELVNKMIVKGAVFYLNGEIISSEQAKLIAKGSGKYSQFIIHTDTNETNGKITVNFTTEKEIVTIEETQDSAESPAYSPIIVNGYNVVPSGFSLSKEDLKNLNLSIKNGSVTGFKFKLPGIPTQVLTGNVLNKEAQDLLNEPGLSTAIIFDIKTTTALTIEPLMVKIIDEK